jgi:hypothetical protein
LRFCEYETMFQSKCKICRSGKAENIEFARFYLGWSYKVIVDAFSEDIDNLNSYNLSNHLNNHVSSETMKFWRSLRDTVSPAEELGLGESN